MLLKVKDIDKESGSNFELETAKILQNLGYKNVYTTKGSGNHGIDVLAINNQGQKVGFQCKHSKQDAYVSNLAVYETLRGINCYQLDKAAIITNMKSHKSIMQKCQQYNIKLIDRKQLCGLVHEVAMIKQLSNKCLNLKSNSLNKSCSIPTEDWQNKFIIMVNTLCKSHDLKSYIDSLGETDFKTFIGKLICATGLNMPFNIRCQKYFWSMDIMCHYSNGKPFKKTLYCIYLNKEISPVETLSSDDINAIMNSSQLFNHTHKFSIITNGHFSNEFKEFAKRHNISLMDIDCLIDFVNICINHVMFNITKNQIINLQNALKLKTYKLKHLYRLKLDYGF